MEDADRILGDGEQTVDRDADLLRDGLGEEIMAVKIADNEIEDVQPKALEPTEDEIQQFVMDGKVEVLCHLGCKPEGVGEVDFVKKKLKNALRNLETYCDKMVLEDPNRRKEANQLNLNAIEAIIKYILNRKIDYRTDSLVKVQNKLMETLKPRPDLPLYSIR